MSIVPGVLTRNWKLKVAALGLALLLWTSLRIEALERQSLPSVPVRVQLNDPQWSLESEPDPRTVEVHFSGPARELFSIYLERPTVTIPVDAVSSADTTVLLRSEWVRLPNRPGVTVEDIEPRNVRLLFEQITQAVVPVSLPTRQSLPGELSLSEPLSLDPEVVRISGPASQVEGVDSIPLQPLDLSQVTQSGTRRLQVDTTGLYGLLVSPGAVQVHYEVEDRVERTLTEVQIVPPQGRDRVVLEPTTSSVTVAGPRSRVEALDPASVWLEVPAAELPELEPGQSMRVPVRLGGVPALLNAAATVDSVTASRPEAGEP